MTFKKSTLESEFYKGSHLPDIGCGIIILLYSVFILNLNVKTHWGLILVVIAGVLFAQFVCSRISNHFLIGKVSKKVWEWKTKGYSMEERTQLFLALHKLPGAKQIEAFFYFFVCAILLATYYHFGMNLNILLAFGFLIS